MALSMTVECQVFRHKLPDLLTGIQDHLSGFVFNLYSEGLISQEIRQDALSVRSPQDQRAASVLTALENRVITRPGDFHAIVRILDASPHLKHLAEVLTAEFQQYSELGSRLGLAYDHDQRQRAVVLTRPVETGNALRSVQVPVQRPAPLGPLPVLTKDFKGLSTPNSPSPSRALASYVSGGPLQYQQRSPIAQATAVPKAECSRSVSSEEKEHSVWKQQADIVDDTPSDVRPQTAVESQMFAAVSIPGIPLSRLPPLSSHSLTPPPRSGQICLSGMIETWVDRKVDELSDSLKQLCTEIERYYGEFQANESLELKEQLEQLQLKEKENGAEMKHLQGRLSESESDVRELTHTVSRLAKLLDQKSTEAEKKEHDKEEEVQSLREELNRARVELQEKEKKINELNRTVRGLRKQLYGVRAGKRRRKSLSCPEFGSL